MKPHQNQQILSLRDEKLFPLLLVDRNNLLVGDELIDWSIIVGFTEEEHGHDLLGNLSMDLLEEQEKELFFVLEDDTILIEAGNAASGDGIASYYPNAIVSFDNSSSKNFETIKACLGAGLHLFLITMRACLDGRATVENVVQICDEDDAIEISARYRPSTSAVTMRARAGLISRQKQQLWEEADL